MQKRDDIQGLRALAVLSVIFYHFSITGFTGGFVGVDVFFVISGYLITGKIVRELTSGGFRYYDFTLGRARRLFPGLLVTIATSFIAGAFLFSPFDFQRQSGSTIAALFGVSNIAFWHEADYFDVAAIMKPLLHTWSLSVEMQFYLIWPFIIVLLARRALLSGLSFITAAGMLAAVVMMDIDQTTAFFLAPFRIWEFALGGMVFAAERRISFTPRISAIGYPVALASVVAPVFVYSETTPFPGLNALPPTLGTAAMILFGPNTQLSKISTLKPAVFLGEISYSAYLVHWPLIVFAQYAIVRDLTSTDKAFLLVATFILSMALYYLVESPFRKPGAFGIQKIAVPYAIAAIAVAIPASSSWAGSGWSWRVPVEIRTANELDLKAMRKSTRALYPRFKAKSDPFAPGKRRIVLAGDSQAADLLNAWVSAGLDKVADIRLYSIIVRCGTIHVPEKRQEGYWRSENPYTVKDPSLIKGCKKSQEAFFNSPILKDADEIYLASNWHPQHLLYIAETVMAIRSATEASITVVGRKDLNKDRLILLNKFNSAVDSFFAKRHDPELIKKINTDLKKITIDSGARFLDLMSVFCPTSASCITATSETQPLFYDRSHLTPAGAAWLGQALKEKALLPVAPILQTTEVQ